MSTAQPLGFGQRLANYGCDEFEDGAVQRLTPRQWRRVWHKERRAWGRFARRNSRLAAYYAGEEKP